MIESELFKAMLMSLMANKLDMEFHEVLELMVIAADKAEEILKHEGLNCQFQFTEGASENDSVH